MARTPSPNNGKHDAIVIGGGPNGLAAAITLAESGRSVLLLEAKPTIGGGSRTEELTLPGFRHDVCSAIHPLALVSPFFKRLNLTSLCVDWIHAPVPLAHPLDNGDAAMLERSIQTTAQGLGKDSSTYTALFGDMVRDWEQFIPLLLEPHNHPIHSSILFTFARQAVHSARPFAIRWFKEEKARALFAGCSAHSVLPLDTRSSAAFGLMLITLAHAVGWPMVRGGSQGIVNALASQFLALDGQIAINQAVISADQLADAEVLLFDTNPEQLARLVGPRLSTDMKRRLEGYQHSPGVFKVDWALDAPIPWKNQSCARAGTIHIGGTLEEIAKAEHEVWQGVAPEKPFVLLSQPSLFDGTRAPAGKHTAWAYCHVPNGSKQDMTQRIETQIERFAPGFQDRIIARHTISTGGMEEYNANYVGGDIIGGVQGLPKLLGSPFGWLQPYTVAEKNIYLCSSSTPPGAGVHGMCGYLAAKRALRKGIW